VRTQAERLDKSGARRRVTLADVSVALCAGAILLATLLAQPFAAPAAQASMSVPHAAATDQGARDKDERTVFLPELYLPVSGDISVPIDQF
jgi:hypothetical protein